MRLGADKGDGVEVGVGQRDVEVRAAAEQVAERRLQIERRDAGVQVRRRVRRAVVEGEGERAGRSLDAHGLDLIGAAAVALGGDVDAAGREVRHVGRDLRHVGVGDPGAERDGVKRPAEHVLRGRGHVARPGDDFQGRLHVGGADARVQVSGVGRVVELESAGRP